jgi:hypothetical protein
MFHRDRRLEAPTPGVAPVAVPPASGLQKCPVSSEKEHRSLIACSKTSEKSCSFNIQPEKSAQIREIDTIFPGGGI